MGIFLWVVFGLLAGWVASMLMEANSQRRLGQNILVGILGALLGGWFMSFIGGTGVTGFNLYSLVVAIAGAIALILAAQAMRRL